MLLVIAHEEVVKTEQEVGRGGGAGRGAEGVLSREVASR